MYAVINNMDFIVQDGEGIMSCANETSLSVREWAGAESETIGVDCNLTHRQQLGTTTKQLRYQLLDWETILTDPNDTFALDRLRGLYAYGMEVAYGILFHDLFQFCMRPVFDVDPISDVSLVLELPRVVTNVSSILQCIESLVVPFQDEVASTQRGSQVSCHLFVLTSASDIKDTALAPMIETSNRDVSTLLVQDGMQCTLSVLPFPDSSNGQIELVPSFWTLVQKATVTRKGWIRPFATFTGDPLLRAGASFIRDQMEYHRHYETWKQGREPFLISPLPECVY
jgi:hypothetical protein